jgi:hypothetical protein
MSTLQISSASPLISSTQPLSPKGVNNEALEHMKYVEQQLQSTPKLLTEEKVSISAQALALFHQESTDTADKSTVKESTNDKLIDSIKLKIVVVKQQLSQIRHDQSEESTQQRRQLQLQLATLNASMLDLLGKKLDAL